MACITECLSPRIVIVRETSASVSGRIAEKRQAQPASHNASTAARSLGGSLNSSSRLRSSFSPFVVRKSVQREGILPAICFTMMAMEFASSPRAVNRSSSEICSMARSASFLY
jgi:hypothetical protein